VILKHLELYRFKCFLNKKVSFAPGFNIIRGPNESGKSTLRTALTTVLFGNPTSSSESIRALTTWGQTERCELRLEYLDESGKPCLLRKDFAAKKIFMIRGEESFQSWKSIQMQISETLGIPTEDLFTLCTSLDVRSLANLGNQANRRQVGKMLAGLMTGTVSGPDILQALKRLDEAIRELGKGERSAAVKNPGPLKASRDLLVQLTARRSEIQNALQTRQMRIETYEKFLTELETQKTRLADLEHLLAANIKLSEASKRKKELVAQDLDFEKRLQERAKLESELETLTQSLSDDPLAEFTLQAIEHLRNLHMRQKQMENEIPPVPERHNIIYFLFGLGGLFSVLALGLFFFKWLVALLVLLSGGGMLIAGRMKQLAQKEKELHYQSQLKQWQAEKAGIEKEIETYLKSAKNNSVEAVLQAWPQTQQKLLEKAAVARRLSEFSVVDEERWQSIRRELRLVEDVLNDPALNALFLSPDDLAARQRDYQKLKSQVLDLSEQKNKLQAVLEHDQVHHDTLVELEEQIIELQDRIQYLEKQERIYRLTYQLLDQARRDTLNPARKVLEKRAGEFMSIFSFGRYHNIAVDDEDLSSKIVVPETGNWESPVVLSQGVFDQFFLSLRLALSEILTGGKKTPIFLDEPLAAFDPERAQAALDCLRQIARERQILFFTCRPDYDTAAEQVIVL